MDFVTQLLEIIAAFFKDKSIVKKDEVIPSPVPAYTPYKGTPSGGKKLEQKLIDLFKSKLESLPAYKRALEQRDAREIFFLACQCLEGVREKGGNNKGPEVELLQETIGTAQSESWCMAYIESAIAFAEYATGIKSPIYASEHCMTVWNKTPKEQRVKSTPLRGAIAIWQHGTSTSGHTGAVESCGDTEFTAYEGNTEGGFSATGAVVRDGGGVYHTKRNRKATGTMKVVGFLKPF